MYWQQNSSSDNSLNRVWIVPEKVKLSENDYTVIVDSSTLNVLMEQDYYQNAISSPTNQQSIKAFKDHILPTLKQQVNESLHFSELRQIHNSVILATWFKNKFKNSFYKNHFNSNLLNGLDYNSSELKQQIHKLYVQSYENGLYDKISKSSDSNLRKRYFSGGIISSSSINNFDISPNLASSVWDEMLSEKIKSVDVQLKAAYDKKFVDFGDAEVFQGQSYVVFDFGEYVLKVPKYKREFQDFKSRFSKISESLGGLAAKTIIMDQVHLLINGEEYFFDGAFAQEKVVSLAELIDPANFEANTKLLNEVFEVQREMFKRGFHNLDHKLLDAYGITHGGKMVIFDLNHVYTDPSKSYLAISDEDWNMKLRNSSRLNAIDKKLSHYYQMNEVGLADLRRLWQSDTDKAKRMFAPNLSMEMTKIGDYFKDSHNHSNSPLGGIDLSKSQSSSESDISLNSPEIDWKRFSGFDFEYSII